MAGRRAVSAAGATWWIIAVIVVAERNAGAAEIVDSPRQTLLTPKHSLGSAQLMATYEEVAANHLMT